MEIVEKLKDEGFKGFVTVEDLMHNPKLPEDEKGVYVVLYTTGTYPIFLQVGTGGFFKEQDPNVSIEELETNWIDGEQVIYIGKATSLRNRLSQYMRFGSGKKVGHKGGRYIWQLKDSANLIVCWKRTKENPRDVEKEMIAEFKLSHQGRRPFANLKD